ncbi:Hypothetical predicted protein [Podarcis lilfordi]|uniref:Uncharacterized protein n=1 Tax=Podarcis lilfordi TaxID=74358 RepID=A0AA35PEE6_9SAUR|nr:Hypothetical predicted protein [Podarcis lilfordi]
MLEGAGSARASDTEPPLHSQSRGLRTLRHPQRVTEEDSLSPRPPCTSESSGSSHKGHGEKVGRQFQHQLSEHIGILI